MLSSPMKVQSNSNRSPRTLRLKLTDFPSGCSIKRISCFSSSELPSVLSSRFMLFRPESSRRSVFPCVVSLVHPRTVVSSRACVVSPVYTWRECATLNSQLKTQDSFPDTFALSFLTPLSTFRLRLFKPLFPFSLVLGHFRTLFVWYFHWPFHPLTILFSSRLHCLLLGLNVHVLSSSLLSIQTPSILIEVLPGISSFC